MERIEELRLEISRHDELYNSGSPVISDEDYDLLVEELRRLSPEEPLLSRVNAVYAHGEKIKHLKPMLSLDKVYSFEEMKKWMFKVSRSEDERFYVMPKYDGISGKFEDGVLSTRGDGYEGTVLNHVLPIIDFGDLDLNTRTHYGELVITNEDFENKFPSVRRKDGSSFKNSRNAVAGIVGNEDVEFYKRQGVVIHFMEYSQMALVLSLKNFDDSFPKFVDTLSKVGIPLDGIVVKLADEEYGESLGATGHHPKHSMAFKFANQVVQTKLIGYEIGMGKDSLSLVGLLEPVECSGVTISRVVLPLTRAMDGTGRSAIDGEIAIGDTIHLKRAGEVIPHVVLIEDGIERKVIKVDVCPFCGNALVINRSSVQCPNDKCSEKLLSRLHFSIVTLGMKGIGRKTVQSIMDTLGVNDLLDFMALKRSDLSKVNSFGEKTVENILNEIEKSRKTKLELFLDALNFPSLGTQNSKKLVDCYSKEEIFSGAIDYYSLMGNSFGEVTSINISAALKKNKDFMNSLSKHFEFESPVPQCVSSLGSICFTGKMSRPRKELEELASKLGYCPVDDVSKDLTLLVVADKNSTSSKMKKALKFCIRVINEEEFFAMS